MDLLVYEEGCLHPERNDPWAHSIIWVRFRWREVARIFNMWHQDDIVNPTDEEIRASHRMMRKKAFSWLAQQERARQPNEDAPPF